MTAALVVRVANVDAEHLSVPVSEQPGGSDEGVGDDVAVPADVHVGDVQTDRDERPMTEPPGAQHGDVGVDR